MLLSLHTDVTTTGGETEPTPAAGGSRSCIYCFLIHLHNNYLLCKHWPSVETPCQLLSDSTVPFSEGNAGRDGFNWFLSPLTHLSNLLLFLPPSLLPSLCGSWTTKHCEVVALLNVSLDNRHCTNLMELIHLIHTTQFNHYATLKWIIFFVYSETRVDWDIFIKHESKSANKAQNDFQIYFVVIAPIFVFPVGTKVYRTIWITLKG